MLFIILIDSFENYTIWLSNLDILDGFENI
jgi:hypothetical protein